SSSNDVVPTPTQQEEELKDEDEEDEADPFIGPLGSFFVTPESFAKDVASTPPEIRLSNVVLKLERKGEKIPPTFVQLRVTGRVLQEVEALPPSPGMEDLSRPTEFAFQIEQSNTKASSSAALNTWGD